MPRDDGHDSEQEEQKIPEHKQLWLTNLQMEKIMQAKCSRKSMRPFAYLGTCTANFGTSGLQKCHGQLLMEGRVHELREDPTVQAVGMIINTAEDDDAPDEAAGAPPRTIGQHWTALFIRIRPPLLAAFFDCSGTGAFEDIPRRIQEVMSRFARSPSARVWNRVRRSEPGATNCGLHCISFLMHCMPDGKGRRHPNEFFDEPGGVREWQMEELRCKAGILQHLSAPHHARCAKLKKEAGTVS
jgi:hypothetical protein